MDYPSPLPIFRCDLALDRAAERFRPSQFEPGDLGSMSPMMLKIQKRIGHRSIRKPRVVSMPIIPSESNSSSDHSVESHYTPRARHPGASAWPCCPPPPRRRPRARQKQRRARKKRNYPSFRPVRTSAVIGS